MIISINDRRGKIRSTFSGVIILCLYLIAAAYTCLALFRYVIDYQRYILYLLWASYGVVAILFIYFLWSMFEQERRKRALSFLKDYFSVSQILLIGLLLWFLLSCRLNESYGAFRTYLGPTNYLQIEELVILDTAICFLVLFPFSMFADTRTIKKMIDLLIHTAVTSYSVFSAICLWHVFRNEVLTLPSGEQAGMTTNVQLMLGYHNNTTGMIALTLFCLCVYMILCQKDWLKIVYIFFAAVQLAVLYLSNSRAVYLAGIVFIIFIGFFFTWYRSSHLHRIKRIIMSTAVALLLGAFFYLARIGMFVLFESITHFNELLENEVGSVANTISKARPVMLSSKVYPKAYSVLLDVEGTKGIDGMRKITDISSRNRIWNACFSLLTSDPFVFLFGVTSVELPGALVLIPEHAYIKYAAHAHNAILQVGTTMGVPAMLMFIAFLIVIIVKSIRIIKRKNFTEAVNVFVIIGTLLCFLVINMAETYLVGYFSVMACFFFLFCGWISAIDAELKKKDLNSSEEV